jgi:hypothetical protein
MNDRVFDSIESHTFQRALSRPTGQPHSEAVSSAQRAISARPSSPPHHHFIDTATNPFQTFLKSLGALPEDFVIDIVRSGQPICRTVHIEATPDDDVAEVKWVNTIAENRCPRVEGIVADLAQCDLL